MRISTRLRGGAAAVVAALAMSALAVAPALASPPAGFTLAATGAASSITLHGAPGNLLHDAVTLHNLSSGQITVVLQPADIGNAANGNADYLTARLYHAGRWLHLVRRRVTLAPHATRRVSFSVGVPPAASGGAHYAGVVAINAADLRRHTRRTSKTPAFTFYRISRVALPVTIHLPGHLSRSLSLRSVKVIAAPIGAGLVLGLLPGGTELTQTAPVKLRVMRGARKIFSYASTLGQLFPGSAVNYRIPWPGRPTPGTYRLIGQIRPRGSAVIHIDQPFQYSAHTDSQLKHETPPVAGAPGSGTPGWIWIVLAAGGAVLIGLSLAVYKLYRRRPRALA